jgi:hypothetical protein
MVLDGLSSLRPSVAVIVVLPELAVVFVHQAYRGGMVDGGAQHRAVPVGGPVGARAAGARESDPVPDQLVRQGIASAGGWWWGARSGIWAAPRFPDSRYACSLRCELPIQALIVDLLWGLIAES